MYELSEDEDKPKRVKGGITFEWHGWMIWKSKRIKWTCDCPAWRIRNDRIKNGAIVPEGWEKKHGTQCKHIRQVLKYYPEVE